jgi:hypothetical protein
MNKVFVHGLFSGTLAGLASLVFYKAYSEALLVDFSLVLNTAGMFAVSIFGCLLASLGFYYFAKIVKRNADVWFNIFFLILTFASFYGPFITSLPTSIESSELFPGMTIPMHCFPIMFWLASKSLFWKPINLNA